MLLAVIALAVHATWAAAAGVSVEVDGTTVTLLTDSEIDRVEHFMLKAPKRLVVDLYGLGMTTQPRNMALSDGFRRLRIGSYPNKTRFVFDVAGERWPAYDIVEEPEKARVVVAWRTRRTDAKPPASRASDGRSPPRATAPAGETDRAAASAAPTRAGDVSQPPISGREAAPGRTFSDVRTTLIFDDGEVKDILRRIAAVSERQIVVDEAVTGRLMLRLVDVPWDQALEMVLSITGLRVIEDGDLLRVMPPPTFGAAAPPGESAQELVGTSFDGSR